MTKIISTLSLAGLIGCSSAPTATSAVKSAPKADVPVSRSSNNSKSEYHLRPYHEQTLANGLKILYVEDAALPYITYNLMLKSGSAEDPETTPGLSNFVAELLDKGTAKHDATKLADAMALLGADFNASVGDDYTMASASTLSTHGEELLNLMVEILLQPSFSENEVDRVRKQILAHLEKQIDNANSFADTVWEDYLFSSHPYGKPASGNLKSIESIKRKHIIQHYLKTYRPNNAFLAVVGKFTPELQQKIETAFSPWQARDVAPMTFPAVPAIHGVQIRLVDKPGMVQSQIRLGEPGIKRSNPDFLTLRVANTVLGGGFASRLVDKVRKQLGLTYSISSGFDARLDVGPFEVSTFTKNQTVGQTISETLKVLSEFREKGVTSTEVDRAKGYLKGVFPAAIETAEKLAYNLLLLRLYGIPDTYLTDYLKSIEQISTSDVNKAIKKYFDDKNLKVLVYSSSEVLPQLQPIGVVDLKSAASLE